MSNGNNVIIFLAETFAKFQMFALIETTVPAVHNNREYTAEIGEQWSLRGRLVIKVENRFIVIAGDFL